MVSVETNPNIRRSDTMRNPRDVFSATLANPPPMYRNIALTIANAPADWTSDEVDVVPSSFSSISNASSKVVAAVPNTNPAQPPNRSMVAAIRPSISVVVRNIVPHCLHLCMPCNGVMVLGLTDILHIKIFRHLVGEVDGGAVCADVDGVSHEVFVEQAVAAYDEAFGVESIH